MISNFKKWEKDYKCEFSEYIRGDKSGKRFNHDIWWCIRFNNCWGRLYENNPAEILVVKYENLTKDPVCQLDKINSFFDLKLTEDSIEKGVNESSKEIMILKDDPDRPAGSVRLDHSMHNLEFDHEDKAFMHDVIKKYMKYDFNYSYEL